MRSRHVRALLAYAGLAALFYLPQLLGLRAFPSGDFNQHFLPFNLFLRSELLAGRLPVWNPYTFAGHPFLADVQAAVFYPLGDLVLALTLPFGDPAARLYFLQAEAALHLALAGFFTYLLVFEITGERFPALLAGCIFAFSGYLTGYPPLQLAVLRTAIWLPLILWLLMRAFRSQSWGWLIGATLAYTAAFLAGHSQTFLYLSYTVAAWFLLLFVESVMASPQHERSHILISCVLRMGAFAVLFLALSAGQLWPSLEFTALSVRASVDYATVSGGLPLMDSWGAVLPGVVSFWSPLYVGIIGLGLALLGAASLFLPGRYYDGPARPQGQAERSGPAATGEVPAARPDAPGAPISGGWGAGERALKGFFVLITLLALLVSYGRHGFLYPVFYRWLPGWGMFRDQERSAYLVTFGLCVLAGFGAAWLRRMRARCLGRLSLAFGASVLAALAVFLLQVASGRTSPSAASLWRAVICCCAVTGPAVAGGVWLGRRRPSESAGAQPYAPASSSPRGKDRSSAEVQEMSPLSALGRDAAGAPGTTGRPVRACGTASMETTRPAWTRGASLALIGLVVADLFLANFPTDIGPLGPAGATALPPEVSALQKLLQAGDGAGTGLQPRVNNEYRVYEDYGMVAGVEDVLGSSPLWLARYAALFDHFPPERMWQLTGVEYVLSADRALGSPYQLLAAFPQAKTAEADPPAQPDVTYLHRLTQPHARAWLATESRIVDDRTALKLLADRANFDPDRTVLLANDAPAAPTRAAGAAAAPPEAASASSQVAAGAAGVRLSQPTPGTIVADVGAQAGSWLVVSENWMPGWQATLRPAQGPARPVPVMRADLTLLAVRLPPGGGRLELSYRPASVRDGLAISAAALATTVALLTLCLRRGIRRAFVGTQGMR
jgi:hypothetical protein